LFGFKVLGLGALKRAGVQIHTSDSLAWSRHARYRPAMSGCTHRNCANCMRYAIAWRDRLLKGLQ
jgi:hypothetical protein